MSIDGTVPPPKLGSSATPPLVTLKKRAEFLRLRGGVRWACSGFAIEMKPVLADATTAFVRGPRFGFTVTKALGNAVVRNRIRRRLKAAVRAVGVAAARPGHDYVIIARADAASLSFGELCGSIDKALARLHGPQTQRDGGRPHGGRSAGVSHARKK